MITDHTIDARFRAGGSIPWCGAFLAMGLVVLCPVIAHGDGLQGMTLVDALRALQEQGVAVIFSDTLVKPAMMVESEPEASEPRTMLEEILGPHGLGVREGTGGQLVVVALPPPEFSGPAADEPYRFSSGFVFLNEIVVTPSHFRIEQLQPENRVFLSKEDVDQLPHVGDDVYRAARRLPGTAAGDYSATFNVRGGEQDELLVLLDGLELLEPFHLKDFQNVFSTIDTESVGGMDFLTGGFPVEYGDRMSGVMDISTLVPEGPPLTSITVGTLNTRVASEGRFDEGKGSWLVNGRAWYPAVLWDLAVDTTDDVVADYYDLFTKVDHTIGSHSTLSANVLGAYDDIGYEKVDPEEIETISARYDSVHVWLNLQTEWTPSLYSRTVGSYAWAERRRTGGYVDDLEGSLAIRDERDLDVAGFKQDWTFSIGDQHYLKWGFDLRRQHARYDYSRVEVVLDPEDDTAPPEVSEITVDLDPAGSSQSAYLADRFRLADSLVLELGLRWDRQFYVGEHQLSPRVNIMYMLSPKTTFRAAWGRFHQSQRLNELQVPDGVTEFYPAQMTEQLLLSVEHRFETGHALRVEAYDKQLDEPRPRYENLFDPLDLFPEAAEDRVLVAPESGRARGFEVLLRGPADRKLTWWASYALARAEDEIDDDWVPRAWDQRHALNAGLSWGLPRRWTVNLAGTFHSGWPVTPVTAEWVVDDEGEQGAELVLGPRNSDRYPDYLRLDIRATKTFDLSWGDLELIFEVLNLTGRENVCCIDEFHIEENEDGSLTAVPEESFWAPIVPSIAVSWRF